MKHLLKKAFLLLALVGGVNSAWAADEVIFSATPTAAWSVPASTTDGEITSSYATISGGKMYLTNNQGSAKDMIKNQGGEMAFQHTNNDTFFKVVLGKALQAGDVISVRMQSRKDADLGLWFSTEASRPGSEPNAKIVLLTAASQAWVDAPTYIVAEGDEIIGQTTFYIYRHTGKSTYFNTFVITRPAPSTDPVINAKTPAAIEVTESGVEVTEDIAVTGANLTGSTLTATLSPAVAGLSVTLGSTTITDGAISTTATLHYTQTKNATGSTTLTLSDGTTSKDVTVNYVASIVGWELQTISTARTWDFSKLTGGVKYEDADLTVEHVYANIEEIGYNDDSFDKTALAFTGEYPLREGKTFAQNGTLRFNTSVPGYIVVKFSDTGTSASATAVKRYLVVNDVTTEYWTSRENNGDDPYDAQLDVTTGPLAVSAGDVTIKGTSALVYSKVEFVPAVSANITSAGWATLYTDKALDFSGVEGLTAYTATCSEGVVALAPVDNVPANTGVVLNGAEGNYNIPVIASSETAQGHLKGSATEATAYNAFTGFTLYVLTSVGANVQFNPVTSGSIAAGKAYLKVDGGTSSARPMEVVFADEILTGINEAKSEVKAAREGKFVVDGQLRIFSKGKMFNANGQLVK